VGVLDTAARSRERWWWVGAAAAPIVIRALVVYQHVSWTALPAYVRARVNVDVLLLESIAITIAAPLAGVATTARRCAVLAVTFACVAAAAAWLFEPATGIAALAPPHLTLMVAAFAMSSIGAAARSCFDHPLDAAACALLVCLATGVGLLVAGPLVEGAPTALVNGALLASPVVATASAADIDLLRGEPLYRYSPIAHSQFAYPAWPMACAAFVVVTALCLAFVVMMSHRGGRTPSAERISV